MSHPEIIDYCKKIIIQYLIDAIGRENIVSVILYGSVARNEESYKYVNGKLYLESDIDVLVILKNRINVIKTWLGLKRLCENITNELRKNSLLSNVNLSITTQDKLLLASPDLLHLALKLHGKVIFGKEMIGLMPHYEHKEYPISIVCETWVFGPMITLVRALASSGIIEGKKSVDSYNSVLKAIRKLTLFMIRAIIIKDSIPLSPYDLIGIKTKRRMCEIKNSEILDDLLKSYDDIKFVDSMGDFAMTEIEKCLVRVIKQFNSTIAVMTGINYPFVSLPKKLIFGQESFIERLHYCLQYGTYLLLTNVRIGWNIGLFKYIMVTTLCPEDISLKFYELFVSSPDLIKCSDEEEAANHQQRQSWLKLYNKTLHPWKYDLAAAQ
jgi:predicted nucleotidyltransferase